MGFAGNIARDRAILAELLERLGLPVTLVSPLLSHARNVAEASGRLGLVAPRDTSSIVPRHTADSMLFALARAPVRGERWLDVGSGAGFPGLVLACCYPATTFTLAEPNLRRAGFLELMAVDLGLNNVAVHSESAETAGSRFDVAVARAFRPPAEAFPAMLARLRVGGVALIAAARSEPAPDGAVVAQIGDLGVVDSPGVVLMMTREA